MSYQNVRAYFEREGIADHITEHDSTADTVEHAARTVGCSPAEIAKSLSFSARRKADCHRRRRRFQDKQF